jgi:ubiquinone/menaquinone biosynthesis C-methylase UbiE
VNHKYHHNLQKNLAISGDQATFFAEYQAQKLATWFPDKVTEKLSILDFGCGDGLMTSFMQHIFLNATIYGVDPSAEHIELAKDMYEGIHFTCSDEKLAFPDNTFDLIYATEVFHHIPRAQHKKYCAELLRVLKPGGALVIFELNPFNIATLYRFNINPNERDAQLMAPHYLTQLLTPYGHIKTRFYDFFPNFLGSLRVLEPYLSWLPFGGLYAVSLRK